jgi:uncharacterized protein YigA (DUF484 family)
MTDKKPTDTKSLTKQDVISWLEKNPDFFVRNPDVLDLLLPPKENSGKGIADFQHYMVKRLKADRDEVLESAREIVETSRANMSNQSRVHRAVLMLMEARNFEDFIRTITIDFATIIGVDIVTLLVEADGETIPHVDLAGVRAVPEGSIDGVMQDKLVLLQSNISGTDEVYGGGARLVKSQALLKLNISASLPPMLIAFGSREPEQFVQGQGTELVTFLGRVLERSFRLWLDLPPG